MSPLKHASILRKFEFGCLLGVALFLPMLEAPKNFFLAAFFILWLVRCFKEGGYGGRWGMVDTVIAGLWVSTLSGTIFAGMHGAEWKGFGDVTRYLLLLWCLSRSGYEKKQWLQVSVVLVSSTILTLGYGAWLHFGTKERMFLELYSVGHVNHTAMYLAILCGILLAALLAFWAAWSAALRGLVFLILLLVFASLLIGSSRGAIGAALLVPIALGIGWLPKSKRPLLAMVIALFAVAAVAFVGNIRVVEKQRLYIKVNDPLSHRDTIWRRAVVVANIFPIFGAGMGNFGKVNDAAIADQVSKAGKTYDPAKYVGKTHAHSLYFNTLAERGWVGGGVFFAALLACFGMLLRHRPKSIDDAYIWAAWGGSLAAWVVVMASGLFNTSLHHEIALLAVMPLGAWLTMRRCSPTSPTGA